MNKRHKSQGRRFAQLGLLLVSLFGFAQGAMATLAADHVIRNTVSVAYADSAGAGQTAITASVDVTVALVAAAATVSVTPETVGPLNTGTSVDIVYTITSNANGLDTYTFAGGKVDADGAASTLTALSGASTSNGTFELELGGTSFASGTGVTFTTGTTTATITVPMDSVAGASALSGFVAGDTIVLNATIGTGTNVAGGEVVCTVSSGGITEGAVFNDTATIALEGCTHAGTTGNVITIQDGDQIGERATLTQTVQVGATNGTITLDSTFTTVGLDAFGATGVATANTVTITVLAVDLQVYKFVRNTTTGIPDDKNGTCPNADATPDFTCLTIVGGATYYATGVSADPGDVLEYAILMYNNTSQVQAVAASDPIALFTTYANDSSATLIPAAFGIDLGTGSDGDCDVGDTGSGTCTVAATAAGTGSPTVEAGTDGSADDWLQFSTNTIFAGAGDDGAGAAVGAITGGQIDGFDAGTPNARSASVVVFQVTVDNN
jgi:hypothetical protein